MQRDERKQEMGQHSNERQKDQGWKTRLPSLINSDTLTIGTCPKAPAGFPRRDKKESSWMNLAVADPAKAAKAVNSDRF